MKFIAIVALALMTNVAFAEDCCVKFPGGKEGTCTLKAPVGNPASCPGGFEKINLKAGVCPDKGAQPKSLTCTSVRPQTATAVMMEIRYMDKSWYFSNP